MSAIYTSDEYLRTTGETWHAEDSKWKAGQILNIMRKNHLRPDTMAEIGCGAGGILRELSKHLPSKFEGYDIAPRAIEMARQTESNVQFHCADMLETDARFDVLLVIDVFEHIPDYMGFVSQCRGKADYKVYHIPLDLSVSSMLRNSFIPTGGVTPQGRIHLHYFTADWALATLKETGHEIVDYAYTNGSFGVFWQHPSFKTALANVPRWLVSKVSDALSARLFGGYSLLVLAK